ncbi:MAG TPA: Uma2 family endonuclease [Gemmataceae bacterium]|nr:Uma2 family endonuclease [Gemmataceae bacterium]
MSQPSIRSRDPLQPTWEIAYLYPAQGAWSEEEYLALDTSRLVEFSDGQVEVLPLPTTTHQFIVGFLYRLLEAFASAGQLGQTVTAPLRVRLWPGKYREPDVVFLRREHANRMTEQFWAGADLVMEVISDDDRRRDVETKRREYARARIPEYWLVDPQAETITILRLTGKRYILHGLFRAGEMAESALLPGFTVDVAAVFKQKLRTERQAQRTPRKPRR